MSDEELNFELESDFEADCDVDYDDADADDTTSQSEDLIITNESTLSSLMLKLHESKNRKLFVQDAVFKLIQWERLDDAAILVTQFLRSTLALPDDLTFQGENLNFLSKLSDYLLEEKNPQFWLALNLIHRIPLLDTHQCVPLLAKARSMFDENIDITYPHLKLHWAIYTLRIRLQSQNWVFSSDDEVFQIAQDILTTRSIDDTALCATAYEICALYEIKLNNWTKAVQQLFSALSNWSFIGDRTQSVRVMKLLILCAATKDPINILLEAAECQSLIRTHAAELVTPLELLKRPTGEKLRNLAKLLSDDPSLTPILFDALWEYRLLLLQKIGMGIERCDLPTIAIYLGYDQPLEAFSLVSTWCSQNERTLVLESDQYTPFVVRKAPLQEEEAAMALTNLVIQVLRPLLKEKVAL